MKPVLKNSVIPKLGFHTEWLLPVMTCLFSVMVCVSACGAGSNGKSDKNSDTSKKKVPSNVSKSGFKATPVKGRLDRPNQREEDEKELPAVSEKEKNSKGKPKETEPEKKVPALKQKVISFAWCPDRKVADAYKMENEADQHKIIIFKNTDQQVSLPVVAAFHGQPKRGTDPRDYWFLKETQNTVRQMIKENRIRPFILVMPVFRFIYRNWPGFNPTAFRKVVEKKIENSGCSPGKWYAFGHSGAAGCGGGGLNRIYQIEPEAVGFFDTCLGSGWKRANRSLLGMEIETVNIFSVETAGFRPRQRPEYQHYFDFGRAFKTIGLKPVACPQKHPAERLRKQEYRCSATENGVLKGYVADTGTGVAAHKALLKPAIEYFLVHTAGL